jgi:GPH family glycoside/pentoside/hexuronide:cation symporter
VWTAAETFGLALGPGLFAVVLALGGYESSTGGDVVQSDTTQAAITYGFSVLPAMLVLVSLWWLARYTLDARQVALAEEAG